jgi:hypothetical protein
MERRLVFDDRERQMRVWIGYDGTEEYFIHESYGARDLVENNKAYAKENPRNVHAGNTQKHMVKVAELPLATYMLLKQLGIMDDSKRFKTWLNDPDNRFFRTYDGRV